MDIVLSNIACYKLLHSLEKKTTFAIWPRKRALWGKLESAIKGFWGLESNLFIDIGKALEIY